MVYLISKVTEEVNMNSPRRNTTVQLSTPTPNTIVYIVTDRQTDRQTDDSIVPIG